MHKFAGSGMLEAGPRQRYNWGMERGPTIIYITSNVKIIVMSRIREGGRGGGGDTLLHDRHHKVSSSKNVHHYTSFLSHRK